MNPKYILLSCAGALLLGACEKNHRDDNLVDPRVYIVNNGLQPATYYDVEETIDYNIYVYSSGYFGQASEVSVTPAPEAVEAYNAEHGSSYAMLDESCYEVLKSSGSITSEGRRTTLVVRLKCAKIMELDFMNDYLVPLRLAAAPTEVNEDLGTILINPRMQETRVYVRETGLVESDLTNGSRLEFTTYIEFDNAGDTRNTYEHGADLLRAWNEAHGTQYIPLPDGSYTFTEGHLAKGGKEAVSVIEIDKAKLTADRYYTLAVKLAANDKFKVSDDNTVLFHIDLAPSVGDNRDQWTLLSCSSYQNNGGPERMIDNDPATRWENRYNNNGSGDKGKLPVTIVWDMGGESYWSGMMIGRRPDKYVTDLKAGYVELSADNETWTKVQEFDFGKSESTSFNLPQEKWSRGRYVRLVVTESNRSSNVSIAEFKPFLKSISE